MTIETQQGKKSWIGDGSTTSYPYSYPFLNASDIEVYLDGNKQTSGFSVQNKTDYSTGANIIFDVAPAEGALIVIRRNIPMTQEISYPENGEFPAKSHEKSLDKLTMLIIDNNKETLKVGPATPEDFDATFPTPEANKALKITADGKGFTMSDYDPDIALALTEDFKNQAQQAAIESLSSQTAAANSEQIASNKATIATTQATIATTQATIATTQAGIATAKTSEVVESGNNAITSITEQETTSKNNIETKGAEQIELIQNEGATQIANVQSAGQTEYNKIIATGIDYKANTDLSNLSEAGEKHFLKQSDKSQISGFGMPSNMYVDLAVGASESTYTAPANGYLFFNGSSTNANDVALMRDNATNMQVQARGGVNSYVRCFIPVSKGATILIDYTSGITVNHIRFIYTQGSESEVS